jgi:hypothetical protein
MSATSPSNIFPTPKKAYAKFQNLRTTYEIPPLSDKIYHNLFVDFESKYLWKTSFGVCCTNCGQTNCYIIQKLSLLWWGLDGWVV